MSRRKTFIENGKTAKREKKRKKLLEGRKRNGKTGEKKKEVIRREKENV